MNDLPNRLAQCLKLAYQTNHLVTITTATTQLSGTIDYISDHLVYLGQPQGHQQTVPAAAITSVQVNPEKVWWTLYE